MAVENHSFGERLAAAIRRVGHSITVGIDPSLALMPPTFLPDATPLVRVETFSRTILDAVTDLVAVVKFQSAYFELLGGAGVTLMAQLAARAKDRGLIVIIDAKRGDIGATSSAYAEAYLGKDAFIQCDAMTLNPYLG
ncbi:MAG: orotidine-5'-phosphate decarboxylase, partial [Myxococcota bacterium]